MKIKETHPGLYVSSQENKTKSSCKSSVVNFTETSEEFSSPKSSPHFADRNKKGFKEFGEDPELYDQGLSDPKVPRDVEGKSESRNQIGRFESRGIRRVEKSKAEKEDVESMGESRGFKWNREAREVREMREMRESRENWACRENAENKESRNTSKGSGKNQNSIGIKQIFEYFEKVIAKVNELDGRIMRKMDSFQSKIEDLETKEKQKDHQLTELNKTLETFNCRLLSIESKLTTKESDISLKTLESLKFSSNKFQEKDTKVANIESSVKKLFSKIRNIEEKSKEPIEKTLINKFASFEDRLSQIEKVSDSLTGFNKNVRETVRKVKKIENILSSPITPNRKHELEYSSPSLKHNDLNKSGAEYESIVMGALIDRANFSLRNSPERPMSAMSLHSSYARAPSNDLKESLRRRGVILNTKHK